MRTNWGSPSTQMYQKTAKHCAERLAEIHGLEQQKHQWCAHRLQSPLNKGPWKIVPLGKALRKQGLSSDKLNQKTRVERVILPNSWATENTDPVNGQPIKRTYELSVQHRLFKSRHGGQLPDQSHLVFIDPKTGKAPTTVPTPSTSAVLSKTPLQLHQEELTARGVIVRLSMTGEVISVRSRAWPQYKGWGCLPIPGGRHCQFAERLRVRISAVEWVILCDEETLQTLFTHLFRLESTQCAEALNQLYNHSTAP